MSSREFNKEERRLRRAKKEMLRLLGLLEDPDRYMEDSDLTQDEKTRLLHEGQSLVAEILTAIAHLHSKETSITHNHGMVNIMLPMAEILRVAGDIPSSDELKENSITVNRVMVNIMRPRTEILRVAGDIPSDEELTPGPFDLAKILPAAGDIPPDEELTYPGP